MRDTGQLVREFTKPKPCMLTMQSKILRRGKGLLTYVSTILLILLGYYKLNRSKKHFPPSRTATAVGAEA